MYRLHIIKMMIALVMFISILYTCFFVIFFNQRHKMKVCGVVTG